MHDDKIKFHKIFLDIFTEKELEDIVEDSIIATSACIIISTDDNYFELSADTENKLDIYCNSNKNGTEKQLTKEEFMILYKKSPFLKLQHINIDD